MSRIQSYHSRVRRLLPLVATFAASAVLLVGHAAAASASGPSCAERFPEAEWTQLRSGAISIESSGVTEELGNRFDAEIALAAGWITDDIGPYSATVCLVSDESAIDVSRFVIGTRLHAHSDLPDRLFVLNIERYGFVAPAGAYALSQHALWQNNGDQAFPEPVADVVGHWYRARILERLEQYHRDVVLSNFFGTESFIDWTARSQEPIQNWDPENNFLPIGDFMDFAVATYGTDILLETDGDVWSDTEGEWRIALRNDLRGRDTDTTGWIGGVALTAAAVVVALIAIALGLWAKHRRTNRAETPDPIPGFFSGD